MEQRKGYTMRSILVNLEDEQISRCRFGASLRAHRRISEWPRRTWATLRKESVDFWDQVMKGMRLRCPRNGPWQVLCRGHRRASRETYCLE